MVYAAAALVPLANTRTDTEIDPLAWVGLTGKPAGSNPDLLHKLRTNPDTGTQFIFLRHEDPGSQADGLTTLSMRTADGTYPVVPQQPGTAVTVHGRDMKMLVADYDIGRNHLVYSTSELMTDTTTGGRDVAAPPGRTVTWNGQVVTGTIAGPPVVSLPPSTNWRFSTEAPEAQPGFDDTQWARATKLVSDNLTHPWLGPPPVLYADDYGAHYGNVWYRAHFNGTATLTGIDLGCATGGRPSTCSVWLNGTFLGTAGDGRQAWSFPRSMVRVARDNVLSVLVENNGHEQDVGSSLEQHKAPRGISFAALRGGRLDPLLVVPRWSIQGATGNEILRGPMNNGGLYGERNGWYLPGFDESKWASVQVPDRWAARGAPPGVGWYRTGVDLHLPAGIDIPIGLRIADGGFTPYEALLFVNGWMVGRFANNLGPQNLFSLPEGMLNPDGHNEIAIAVLSHGPCGDGGGLGTVTLQAYGRYRGG